MKKMKIIMTILCMTFMLLGVMSNASALTITPDDATWWGNDPGNPSADDIEDISNYNGELIELYKQDTPQTVGYPLPQSTGSYANSYTTNFFPDIYEPEDAIITYVPGQPSISGSPLYLLVKDGNKDITWYIFDLSNWNGTETIYLNDFWVNINGAISHVAIYGTTTTVPEPTTLLLIGLGLIGVARMSRKIRK